MFNPTRVHAPTASIHGCKIVAYQVRTTRRRLKGSNSAIQYTSIYAYVAHGANNVCGVWHACERAKHIYALSVQHKKQYYCPSKGIEDAFQQ